MARINDPMVFPYDVFVYGGDSYGTGRNEHGDPHFHFADKIKGGNWHDGYDETHYAYLENIKTKLFEKKMIVYLNLMCQVQNFFAIKI